MTGRRCQFRETFTRRVCDVREPRRDEWSVRWLLGPSKLGTRGVERPRFARLFWDRAKKHVAREWNGRNRCKSFRLDNSRAAAIHIGTGTGFCSGKKLQFRVFRVIKSYMARDMWWRHRGPVLGGARRFDGGGCIKMFIGWTRGQTTRYFNVFFFSFFLFFRTLPRAVKNLFSVENIGCACFFIYRPLKVSIMSLGSVLGALTWWSINFLNVCLAILSTLTKIYIWNINGTNAE